MKMRRKGVLLAGLVVAVFGASVGAYNLRPQHGVCVSRNIMFWRTNVHATKLRDNLYMLNTYGTDLINANTTALIGDDGILLVDPGHPEMVDKERAALPSIADPRVRIVIDSHGHFDHACANARLYDEGAIVIGRDSIWDYLSEASSWHPRQRGDAPQIVYDRELNLRFDGEHVRLIHVPPAHTNGDTITVFAKANVIDAGDIFVNGTFPYMEDGDIDGYIAAHELLLQLSNDQTLIIPGHGALARRGDVEKSLGRMREVRRRIAELIKEGMTKEQVLARHPLDDLQPGPSREVLSSQSVAGFVYASMSAHLAKRVKTVSLPHPAQAGRTLHH